MPKINTNFMQKQDIYNEQTSEDISGYGIFLAMIMSVIDAMRDYPRMQEYIYEIEKSKQIFPDAFNEVEEIKTDMKLRGIGKLKLGTLSGEE